MRAALRILEPLYLGENPLEPERVSEKLHANTFWMGRGGSITHAISGIDIAMWDILGKATSQPVGRLLGGRYRDRALPYASLLMREPAALAEHLAQLRVTGISRLQNRMGTVRPAQPPDGRGDRACRARRRWVGSAAHGGCRGERCILADRATNGQHGQRRCWPRTPCTGSRNRFRPMLLNDYVLLRTTAPVPIAGGEVLTRRQSFTPWLQQRAFDIVQPDVTKVGGISEERRIAWMAEEYGVRFIPHGWNTALGLAADLHLASACRDADMVEYLAGISFHR